ncbi:hypothetical protein LTR10_009385 [Elasticomyces elasticus]|nr:hypothetical protein LTR10_009385 [Elasticomyces elasticus]KAK4971516.1 hypothetical protein LTR42_007244 [Elasticomyces elasticus]
MATEDDLPTASPLMRLSAELRNIICELVILKELRIARIGPNGHLIKKPGLLATCRQLRRETLPVYQDLAPTAAERLTVTVRDLNFMPLITYLHTISAEHRMGMSEKRNLRIELRLSPSFSGKNLAGVRRWTQYCGTTLVTTMITRSDTDESAYVVFGDSLPQPTKFMEQIRRNAVRVDLPAEIRKAEERAWIAMGRAWEARKLILQTEQVKREAQEDEDNAKIAKAARKRIERRLDKLRILRGW